MKLISWIRLSTVIILLTGVSFQAYAQQVKSLIIMDFKNKSGDKNIDYLEGSITDAVKEKLLKSYTFNYTTPEVWRPVAQKNYIYDADWHTDTAAMSLGLITKQDIVMNGQIIKGNTKNTVMVEVNIYEISARKKAKTLSIPLALSSSMFQDIEKLAQEASAAAVAVLPNKDDWKKSGLDAFARQPLNNIALGFSAGLLPYSSTGSAPLNENSNVTADNFSVKFNFQLQFRRHKIFLDELFVFSTVLAEMASADFQTEAGSTAAGKLLAFDLTTGMGYVLWKNIRWQVSVFAGAGAYFQNISYQFDTVTSVAVNTSTRTLEESKSFDSRAVSALGGFSAAYRFTPEFSARLDLYSVSRFFGNATGGSFYLLLGGSYDF